MNLSKPNSFFDLASGDILLYCSDDPIHLALKRRTHCRWAHIAIVLKQSEEAEPIVFESTRFSACRDLRLGIPVQGVQVSELAERIQLYPGDIAWRKLTPALSANQIEVLWNFVDEIHGRPFNSDKRELVKALRRKNQSTDGSNYFCSQLVAEAYQRIGLLPLPPLGNIANNYVPPDFSSAYAQAYLPLHPQYSLGPEVILTNI